MLEKLIIWQKQNGYLSKYVACKIGLTQKQYSDLKKGKRKATAEDVLNFEKAFNVGNAAELLTFKGAETDERRIL